MPRLTRCFRGHSTAAGNTFCDTCGASLESVTVPTAPAPPALAEDEVSPAPLRGWRQRLHRPG